MRKKVVQMQETTDLEIGGVLKRSVDSSPKALENDLEEGLLVLLSGVMEVAGSQAVGALAFVPQALDAVPGDQWENEDEESYYSDEDGEEGVNPDLAGKGIGECGRVQLSESLWSRAVPDDLLDKYRSWLNETGGGGTAKEWEWLRCLRAWWRAVLCAGCHSHWVRRARPVSFQRIAKSAASS